MCGRLRVGTRSASCSYIRPIHSRRRQQRAGRGDHPCTGHRGSRLRAVLPQREGGPGGGCRPAAGGQGEAMQGRYRCQSREKSVIKFPAAKTVPAAWLPPSRHSARPCNALSTVPTPPEQGNITVTRLDLADLASVQEAGRHLAATLPSLDLLVLNAGVRRAGGEEEAVGGVRPRLISAPCLIGAPGNRATAAVALLLLCPPALLIPSAGDGCAAQAAHQGRLRAAVRDQPSWALLFCQPAAAQDEEAGKAGHWLLRWDLSNGG